MKDLTLNHISPNDAHTCGFLPSKNYTSTQSRHSPCGSTTSKSAVYNPVKKYLNEPEPTPKNIKNNYYTGKFKSNHLSTKPMIRINGLDFDIPHAELGWYPKILGGFIGELDIALKLSRRVLVGFFELNMTGHTACNHFIEIFMRRFKKAVYRRYPNLMIGYQWVREQERSKRQHYHLILIVDATRVTRWDFITQEVTKAWKGITGLQAHSPKRNFYRLSSEDKNTYVEVIQRASYNAKGRGKKHRPPQTKDHGKSRLNRLLKTTEE